MPLSNIVNNLHVDFMTAYPHDTDGRKALMEGWFRAHRQAAQSPTPETLPDGAQNASQVKQGAVAVGCVPIPFDEWKEQRRQRHLNQRPDDVAESEWMGLSDAIDAATTKATGLSQEEYYEMEEEDRRREIACLDAQARQITPLSDAELEHCLQTGEYVAMPQAPPSLFPPGTTPVELEEHARTMGLTAAKDSDVMGLSHVDPSQYKRVPKEIAWSTWFLLAIAAEAVVGCVLAASGVLR